jgi:serine-type D-Ala-D-Ala carboxypeptidase/endopeptidase
MDATTFELASVPADRRVSGYVRRDDGWTEEPIDGYGALASMGGVFTSIRDLARWVAGFTDAFAPPGTEEMTHPLTRVSRRAMQQIHRSIDPEIEWASVAARPALVAGGYGYGLFAFDDPTIGRTVGHGGGYPGFGSHMRWHPGSGIGVIAFGNVRYARMGVPVVDALRRLATGEVGRRRSVTPWPETVAARAGVERLLEGWDDSLAAGLFSMNVELDEPLERRRTAIDRLRSVHGALRPDPGEEPSSDAPSHLGWWMRGERGRVFIDILLDPQVPPRVQSIDLTSVPEPPEPLAVIASRLAALCSSPAPDWPADIPTVATLDLPEITRELRATAALYGPLSVGEAVNGDGRSTARWRLISARGALDLELRLDDSSGDLISVVFQPRKIRVPIHET